MTIEFSLGTKNEFDKLVARYPEKRAALLPALHLAQKEFGHITPEVEEYVAGLFELTPAKVREVVTFYTLYHTKEPGRHVVQVCRTISCHLNGSAELIDYLKEKLGAANGETTEDGKFTLQVVECLGACEFAPVMQVGENYYGPLTKAGIDEALGGLE